MPTAAAEGEVNIYPVWNVLSITIAMKVLQAFIYFCSNAGLFKSLIATCAVTINMFILVLLLNTLVDEHKKIQASKTFKAYATSGLNNILAQQCLV